MQIEINREKENLDPVCCDQKNFTLLLSKKYQKKYHIVDSPALSYSLARKSSQSTDILKLKNTARNSHPIFGSPKQNQKRKIKQPTRVYYINLKQKVSTLLKQINSNLKDNKLALSQIFQYNQVVLRGFLSEYLDNLRGECIEESQFMRFIWNQTLQLMESIIKIQQKSQTKTEKDSLQQIIRIHQTYQNTLQKQAQKRDKYKQQIKNLKQIIEYLVQKLRIKKKEVKKIYKSEYQLINKLNQFKDQTVQSELKYIDLKLQSEDLTQAEINRYLEQKKQLIKLRNSLLKIDRTHEERRRQIELQVNLQGHNDLDQFVVCTNSVFEGKNQMTSAEMEAKIDEVFDAFEDQFEEREFRMRKIAKNKGRVKVPQSFYINKATMARPQDIFMNHYSSQTTYSDKFDNNLINNVGCNVGTSDLLAQKQKKRSKKQQQTQCDGEFKIKKYYQGTYQRVIQMSIYNPEVDISNHEEDNVKTIFKIKYIQKDSMLQRKCSQKIFSNKNIQCQGDPLQQYSQQENKQDGIIELKKDIIPKKKKSLRKSRFFTRQQTDGKLFKSKIDKQKIGQRFSTVHNSPAKFQRQSFQQQLSGGFKDYDPKNRLRNKQNSNNRKSRRMKEFSVQSKNRNSSVSSIASEVSKPVEKYTSLSRKTEVKLPPNIESILKKEYPKKQDQDQELYDFNEPRKLQKDQLFNLLLDLSVISSESDFDKEQTKYRFRKQNENIQQNLDLVNTKNQINNNYQQFISQQKQMRDRFNSNNIEKENNNKGTEISIKRKSATLVDTMLTKIVYNKIKKNRISRVGPKLAKSEILFESLEPIAQDVRKKIRQSSIKTKKMILPVKHNNIFSIITSVFLRSWDLIKNNQPIKTFLPPLFETMTIIYGTLPQQQIYKKVINFIAQISLQQDKIYQTFLFFLAMDDQTIYSQQVTSFETYLFLKLVVSLSKVSNPFKQLDKAYTSLQIIERRLQEIFIEDDLPNIISQKILQKLKFMLYDQDTRGEEQVKLDLFSCTKKIIIEILIINENVKETFRQFLALSSFQNQSKKISFQDVKLIIECQATCKQIEMKQIKKLYYLKPDMSNLSQEQFISYILRLKFTSFEELYVEILNKYGITTFQSLKQLQRMKQNEYNIIPKLQKARRYQKMHQSQTQINLNKLSQIQDLYMLNHAEKNTEKVLEKILGKNLNKLYGLSIIILE